MKLKYLVMAIGLAVAAGSQAQVIPPQTAGGGELLLTVWEQGAPNGPDESFTIGLSPTFNSFVLSGSASSISPLAVLSGADPIWASFLATADTVDAGALQWSVISATGKYTATGTYGILSTVTNGQEATAAAQGGSNMASFETQVNTFATALPGPGLESVNTPATAAYYQYLGLNSFNGLTTGNWTNSNAIGATATVDATIRNIAPNTKVLPGTMTFAEIGTGANAQYVLSYDVAAVPEASGSTMALAGLAVMGFLGLRRRKQS